MTTSARFSAQSLVRRARQGDQAAWEALYRAHARRLRQVSAALLGPQRDVADDLVHDAFLLAHAGIGRLRQPERFGPWLTTIVTHLTLQYLERTRRHPAVSLDETPAADLPPEPNDPADTDMPTLDELMNLVNELPEGYRQVFRLAVIEGLPHAEIGRRLGIAPHSSSSQLHRAKQLLRRLLAARHGEKWIITALALLSPWSAWLLLPLGPRSERADGWQLTLALQPETAVPTPAGLPPARRTPAAGSTPAVRRQQAAAQPDTLPAPALIAAAPAASPGAAPPPPHAAQPQAPGPAPHTAAPAHPRRPWRLLLGGAVGPALAQMIYPVIHTGSPGNAGSGAVPENISTWEEYYAYLAARQPLRPDSAALLHIAQNNSGPIAERIHYSRPLTLGLTMAKTLTPRWRAEAGLQYTRLQQESEAGSGVNVIRKRQQAHYLSLPVRASFTWLERGAFSAYASGGLALHIPLTGRVSRTLLTDSLGLHLDGRRIRPGWHVSVSGAVGASFRLTPRLSLYAEPTVQYYLPTPSGVHTLWTDRPLSLSLPLGLRLTW